MPKRKIKRRVVKKSKIRSRGLNKILLLAIGVILVTLGLVFVARQYGIGPLSSWAAQTIGINSINVDADDGSLVAVMPSINAVGTACMTECLSKGTVASTCGSRCASTNAIAAKGGTTGEITETVLICPKGKKPNNKKTACIDKDADSNSGPDTPKPTKAQCEALNKNGNNGWTLDTKTGKCTQISSKPNDIPPATTAANEEGAKCTGINGITFSSGDTVVGPVITVGNNEKKDSVYECTNGNWKIKSTCGPDGKQFCTLQDNPDTVTVKPSYQIISEASESGGKPEYNCKKDGTLYSSGTYLKSANEVCSSGSWKSPDEYFAIKKDECKNTTGVTWDDSSKECKPLKGDKGTIVNSPEQCKSGKVQYIANGVLKCIENSLCKPGCTGSSNRTCDGNILRVTICPNGCDSLGKQCNGPSEQQAAPVVENSDLKAGQICYLAEDCDECPYGHKLRGSAIDSGFMCRTATDPEIPPQKGSSTIGDTCNIPSDCGTGYCQPFTHKCANAPSNWDLTVGKDGKYLANVQCSDSSECSEGLSCQAGFSGVKTCKSGQASLSSLGSDNSLYKPNDPNVQTSSVYDKENDRSYYCDGNISRQANMDNFFSWIYRDDCGSLGCNSSTGKCYTKYEVTHDSSGKGLEGAGCSRGNPNCAEGYSCSKSWLLDSYKCHKGTESNPTSISQVETPAQPVNPTDSFKLNGELCGGIKADDNCSSNQCSLKMGTNEHPGLHWFCEDYVYTTGNVESGELTNDARLCGPAGAVNSFREGSETIVRCR